MLKIPVPEVLPTSPLSLWCPYCGASPGDDCETLKGGVATVHLLRVAAAALIDEQGRDVRATAKRDAARINKTKKKRTH
jgi:hypothetical protein